VSPQLFPVGGSPAAVDADAVVIGLVAAGVRRAAPASPPAPTSSTPRSTGSWPSCSRCAGATGKADEVVKLPTRGTLRAPLLVAVGLGKRRATGLRPEQVRRASGAAARALAGTDHAVSTLRPAIGPLAAAAEGSLLGAYAFTTYRTNGNRKARWRRLLAGTDAADAERGLRTATAVARPCAPPATWSTPRPTTSTPRRSPPGPRSWPRPPGSRSRCSTTPRWPRPGSAACSGWGRAPRASRGWCGCAGRWAAPRAHVALVGKGITFDTGGISIKPAANMDHMTSDMSGAAAVIATTVLAATLELPVAVTATVPMAENMPSDTAYRPGDVLRMYGGRTVEVLNTDAEGG
jgi:leucyl aminopeptidase